MESPYENGFNHLFLICAQVISAQEKNFSLDLKDVTVKEALEQLKSKNHLFPMVQCE